MKREKQQKIIEELAKLYAKLVANNKQDIADIKFAHIMSVISSKLDDTKKIKKVKK